MKFLRKVVPQKWLWVEGAVKGEQHFVATRLHMSKVDGVLSPSLSVLFTDKGKLCCV